MEDGGYRPKKKRRSFNFFNQDKCPEDFGIFMGNDGDDESCDEDEVVCGHLMNYCDDHGDTVLSNSVSQNQ